MLLIRHQGVEEQFEGLVALSALIYLSVAQWPPVMQAYIAVRAECGRDIANRGMPATVFTQLGTARKYRRVAEYRYDSRDQATSACHLLYIADIEALDQPVSHVKDMGHQFVAQEIALEVMNDLMNFDTDFSFAVGRHLDGLD
ncbi:MAG: hypothetical protein JO061_02090, partial [Acidobacteriaceae bacterium]|nr:hypothetical protein [Acidobacteriaceae bacterium]